jgi:hypothetical protein
MSKSKTALISIILAILLGGGGYVGGMLLFAGVNPLQQLLGLEPALVSDIPTDKDGRNLYGNHMVNLDHGGLVTMQSRDVFYVNLADSGSLYCQDAKGNITKLTDFAAANLNVVGERLIFTDLQYCVAISESGEPAVISADSHQELWEAAGADDRLVYGGNLYCIDGVKSYLAGEIDFEQLELSQLADGTPYLSPLAAEGYFVVLSVEGDINAGNNANATPLAHQVDIKTMPLSRQVDIKTTPLAATVRQNMEGANCLTVINDQGQASYYKGEGGSWIQSAKVVGNKLYVETSTYSPAPGEPHNRITVVDLTTDTVLGYYPGYNLQATNDNVYFQSDDRIIMIDSQNYTHQVNETPADNFFTLGADGTIYYRSNLDKGPPPTALDMRVDRLKNGYYRTGRDVSMPEWYWKKALTYTFGGVIHGVGRNSQTWGRGEVTKTGWFRRKTTHTPLDDWNKVAHGKPLNPKMLTAGLGGIAPTTAEYEEEAMRQLAAERRNQTPASSPETFYRDPDDEAPAADSAPDNEAPAVDSAPAPDEAALAPVTPTPTPARQLGGEHYVDLNGGTIKGKWKYRTSTMGDIILEFTNGKVTIFHTQDSYTITCSYTIRIEPSTQNHVYWTDYTHMMQLVPDDPDEFYIGFISTNFRAGEDIPIATTPTDNALYIGGIVFAVED